MPVCCVPEPSGHFYKVQIPGCPSDLQNQARISGPTELSHNIAGKCVGSARPAQRVWGAGAGVIGERAYSGLRALEHISTHFTHEQGLTLF